MVHPKLRLLVDGMDPLWQWHRLVESAFWTLASTNGSNSAPPRKNEPNNGGDGEDSATTATASEEETEDLLVAIIQSNNGRQYLSCWSPKRYVKVAFPLIPMGWFLETA
jgi:hypothetical protein